MIYWMLIWSEWYTECQYGENVILVDGTKWMIYWMSIWSEFYPGYRYGVNDIVNVSMEQMV